MVHQGTRVTRRELLGGAAALGLWGAFVPLARAAAPPFPELRARGKPAELGLAHGRAFAERIRRNVAFYLKWLADATGADAAHLLGVAGSFAAPLGEQHPELLEEVEAIARGAKRSREEILLVNARTDLLLLGQRRAPAKPDRAGCTALALEGRTAAGAPLLALGQNWDWRPDLAEGVVVLRLEPAAGPALVTFTEAGMVGKIGFNAQRLGVCLNFLAHAADDPRGAPGVPVHALLRAVLGCSSIEQAYKLVAWAPRSASANFLLAQHAPGRVPAALDLELTPASLARVQPRGGVLVHTNHFVDPSLAAGCTGRDASSLNRARVALEDATSLARSVSDPVTRMQRILRSRHGAPLAVSKTSAPGSLSMTLAGIVMDLSRNRLHLCAGPPHAGRFATVAGI